MDTQLRLATPDDAQAIQSIYAPFVESTPISFEIEPPTTTEMAERIETTLRQYPWFVCETDEDDILGYATASSLRTTPPYAWTAELTIYLAEDAQQSGIGTALYTALMETLQEQGFYNAYAAVTVPNPASAKLHKRMGFEPVGTFPAVGYKQGEWHDIRWWHRQLADHPADPDPPRPLTAIGEAPGLEHILRSAEQHIEI